MIRSIAVILALVFFAGGCGESQPEGAIRAPRTTTVTEQGAIDIARDTVRDRDGWSDAATFEAEPTGNGWTVTVWRGAADTSDMRLVVLDESGDVVLYEEG
ncbi:MAG: hypothetical protein ACYSVY_28425 [Planctomycetota bacterium]|jgi:hypothetical protein